MSTTVNINVWLSLKSPSVTVTVTVYSPSSSNPGVILSEPLPSPLSVKLTKAGAAMERLSVSPISASVADNSTVSMPPSSTV